MPYYVYKVFSFPIKRLELMQAFPAFKEASAFAKGERAKLGAEAGFIVKVVFGENELHAEDTLSQVREHQPLTGEDY